MKHNPSKRNSAWNIAEAATNTIVLFVLYKLIISKLGLSSLGVWSLVLATTSIARIADLGAAGGLGRYIALRRSDPNQSQKYLETAIVANAGFYSVVCLLAYWPAKYAVDMFVATESRLQAENLLPYAIVSFGLLNVSNVLSSALIGLGRSDRKSLISIGALASQVLVATLLIGDLDLRAVALGQLAQCAVLIIAGWFLAVREIRGKWSVLVPRSFDPAAFRELVGFGLRLQILNIAAFPFEPLIKFILSAGAGLAALGLYETASRGFLQVRQLVIAPSQNLTPLFARAHQDGRAALEPPYRRATVVMIAAAALSMGALAFGSPVISLVWLGEVQPMFVVYSVVLSAGWFINIAATPGYYLGIGSGRLRWNIAGAATTSLMTALAASALGRIGGPAGAVSAAMVSLGVGGLLTWVLNARDLNMPILPRREDWTWLLGAVVARLSGSRALVEGQK